MNTITLYHGSICDFDVIDLKESRAYKDFGQGFYCSETRSQAVGITVRNYLIELTKLNAQKNSVKALCKWLYTYEFPRSAMDELSVKVFDTADKAWLQFVSENRRSAVPIHNYDIVIGPTANDRTNASILLYFSGAYGQVGTDRAMEILLEVLMPNNLPTQTFFATERAVQFLIRIKKAQISRLYRQRHNIGISEFNDLDRKINLLGFIEIGYESFHLTGEEGILDEVDDYCRKQLAENT